MQVDYFYDLVYCSTEEILYYEEPTRKHQNWMDKTDTDTLCLQLKRKITQSVDVKHSI